MNLQSRGSSILAPELKRRLTRAQSVTCTTWTDMGLHQHSRAMLWPLSWAGYAKPLLHGLCFHEPLQPVNGSTPGTLGGAGACRWTMRAPFGITKILSLRTYSIGPCGKWSFFMNAQLRRHLRKMEKFLDAVELDPKTLTEKVSKKRSSLDLLNRIDLANELGFSPIGQRLWG